MKHRNSVRPMLGKRRRRWTKIGLMSGVCWEHVTIILNINVVLHCTVTMVIVSNNLPVDIHKINVNKKNNVLNMSI